jgi:hypothetical protein
MARAQKVSLQQRVGTSHSWSDRCVQDDRTAISEQRERFLHCEEHAFDIRIEDLIEQVARRDFEE